MTRRPGLPQASLTFGAPWDDGLQRSVVLDVRGRVTLPMAMRRSLALDPGGRLVAEVTADGVLLRPAVRFPFDPLDPRQARAVLELDRRSAEAFLRKRRKR